MGLFNNDEALAFFEEWGYPTSYNDGMLAWLREVYNTEHYALNDLLHRYLADYGDRFNMIIAGREGNAQGYITPAATFTNTTPSSAAAGADTLLTSAGVHGLTSAVAVGKRLYISAGTGWTVGFHTITAIAVDTTGVTIQIDTPYSASMGTPTIALAGTEVTFVSVTIPILRAASHIEIDATWSYPNNANSKQIRAYWGGNQIYAPNVTTTLVIRPSNIVVQNRNSTSSQVLCFPKGAGSFNGATTTAADTYAIDTSVATQVTLGGTATVANDFVTLERYIVLVYL